MQAALVVAEGNYMINFKMLTYKRAENGLLLF